MPTAKLHFDNGSEVDQPIPEGQTVPYRLQHIEDQDDEMTVRTFAYRKRQPSDSLEIHYDELTGKTESVRKTSA